MNRGPSELEKQLKQIVEAHPRARLHPHSPSGPYVRAVMWSAEPGLLGQAFRQDDGTWAVRAFVLAQGQDSLAVEHPPTMDAIAEAITSVIAHLTPAGKGAR
ncbi:hypothetical protein ABZ234_31870 [Nocardiopsis sp. NPDC006198]|uniref:hypothetical protein n=1 Tax=Nocardiopsis sp. NPDC006198 TaxID=3154472 RepID=UPI0033B18A3C